MYGMSITGVFGWTSRFWLERFSASSGRTDFRKVRHWRMSTIWVSAADCGNSPTDAPEFEMTNASLSRRRFLPLCGLLLPAARLAGAEPVTRSPEPTGKDDTLSL